MEVPAQRLDEISCAKKLRAAAEARFRKARGEPERLVPVAPDSPAGFTENTPPLYRKGYEYYRTPQGRHPNSLNRGVFSSLPLQMAFFPFEQIDTISPRAVLLIAGSKADTLFWSEQACHRCKDPRGLYIVNGASHIEMYDRPPFVTPAVAKLAAFFGRHLGQGGSSKSCKRGVTRCAQNTGTGSGSYVESPSSWHACSQGWWRPAPAPRRRRMQWCAWTAASCRVLSKTTSCLTKASLARRPRWALCGGGRLSP